MRENYTGKFKAKVVVDVIRENETLAELSSKYQVHRTMLDKWKKEAIDGLPALFSSAKKKNQNDTQNLINELYRKIGQLEVENDWLKKRLMQSIPDRRGLIDKQHPSILNRRNLRV